MLGASKNTMARYKLKPPRPRNCKLTQALARKDNGADIREEQRAMTRSMWPEERKSLGSDSSWLQSPRNAVYPPHTHSSCNGSKTE